MDRTATLEAEHRAVRPAGVEASGQQPSLRRFTIAVITGGLVVSVPYLWVLTDLWNRSPSLLRTVIPNGTLSNFYDLQARAMFHGHLYVPNGSLAAEAFVHDGRQYTYFGLFPSLLRMPVLLVTHSLDGRLTASSMLLAWLVTGLFSALLLWRVRLLLRGQAPLGRAEATSYGVLIATIMGGSVLVALAASPWVYSEDVAWSAALTIGSLFALLGVLEAPSWGRVTFTGALVLAANLTRGTTGYACVIGTLLAAAWLASGRRGREHRRWWWPVLLAGVIPLAIGAAVGWAKFGVLYGYPLYDQIAFKTHRLNAIKGSYFSFKYLPTTLAAYLGSSGMHLSRVFPFITFPAFPARAVGNVPLFGTDFVTSVPGSMPLLSLLTLWGVVAAFRRRASREVRLTSIPMIAAGAAAGSILIFGFLYDRFLGDVLPLLVLGSVVGLVDLWRHLEWRRPPARGAVVAMIGALGLFGVLANTAIASTPTGWWSDNQAINYVETQKSVSDLTGHPLSATLVRGRSLPRSATFDELFVAGNCAGLYLYSGQGFPNGLRTWFPLDREPPYRHALDVTIHGSPATLPPTVPLVSAGVRPAIVVSMQPAGTGQIRFVESAGLGNPLVSGTPFRVQPDTTYRFAIETDLTTDSLSVTSYQGDVLLSSELISAGPITVHARGPLAGASPSPVSVVDVSQRESSNSLCRSLVS